MPIELKLESNRVTTAGDSGQSAFTRSISKPSDVRRASNRSQRHRHFWSGSHSHELCGTLDKPVSIDPILDRSNDRFC